MAGRRGPSISMGVRHSQEIAALEARTDPDAKLTRKMGVTVIPPAWTHRGEQSREDEDEDVAAATGQLAEVLAAQLGVPPAKIVEALKTSEARECLGDLSEVWVMASEPSLDDEDDLEEDEEDPGEEVGKEDS